MKLQADFKSLGKVYKFCWVLSWISYFFCFFLLCMFYAIESDLNIDISCAWKKASYQW